MAPALCARFRDHHERTLWLQRIVSLLGLDPRFVRFILRYQILTTSTSDAADFYDASIFADPDPLSGLGGWGNPLADYAVQDGAFANFRLTYPYQHTLRRNFTLRPFIDEGLEYHIIPDKMANTSITPGVIRQFVEGYKGDYRGFQRDFEFQQVNEIFQRRLRLMD